MTVFAPPQEEFVPLKLQNQWKMFIGQGIDDKFVPYADYTDSITMPDGNTVAAQDFNYAGKRQIRPQYYMRRTGSGRNPGSAGKPHPIR